MSYTVSRTIIEGLKIVVAMEQNVLMPSVEDINKELSFIESRVIESEKFVGVPFRAKQKEYNVIQDVKSFLEEFYFGEATRGTHPYRIRPLYRIVIEPLLEDMSDLSHDQILDYISAVTEQLKEYALLYRSVNKMDYKEAYAAYQAMADKQATDKKIKTIVDGVMKLRRKSLALFSELKGRQFA